MKAVIKSLTEMRAFARGFLENLTSSKNWARYGARATVVGLHGDLGSGKTAFVQAVGAELGIKEKMASPTFVLRSG